ncbi:MAG: phage portal protein [Nitrospinae bacterium]|nr:phage portal protein [Nitrospinota bacterium]
MNIFHWIKNIATKQSAVSRALTLFLPLDQGVSTRADYATLAKEGFTQNSVVFACIKEIAGAAAGVDWLLYQRLADGGRKEILSHPLLNLIQRPNPLQGKFEFIESAIGYLYVSGNAYLEMVGPTGEVSSPRNNHAEGSPPREIYALRPDRMKIVPHPVNLVAGYEYRVNGQTVYLSRDRILHLKLFHPLDDWYGFSPIQVAALAIDKLNAGDKWNSALLRNSAVPSGALVSKERLTDEQFSRLKKEMREQIQGIRNAREPLLLEQDLDWKELSISPKDMDWIEGLKFSALQIAQIYNMPPELIGLQPATYQNRKEGRKALYTEVVCPALNRLRDAFNNQLTPKFGKDLFLDYDKDKIEALAEDQESLWKRANDSQFLTINEKRHLVGYDDIPGGDGLVSVNPNPSS